MSSMPTSSRTDFIAMPSAWAVIDRRSISTVKGGTISRSKTSMSAGELGQGREPLLLRGEQARVQIPPRRPPRSGRPRSGELLRADHAAASRRGDPDQPGDVEVTQASWARPSAIGAEHYAPAGDEQPPQQSRGTLL